MQNSCYSIFAMTFLTTFSKYLRICKHNNYILKIVLLYFVVRSFFILLSIYQALHCSLFLIICFESGVNKLENKTRQRLFYRRHIASSKFVFNPKRTWTHVVASIYYALLACLRETTQLQASLGRQAFALCMRPM